MADKNNNEISSVVVSSGVLADLLGVTDRRIRQLAEEGVVEKTARGRYKLRESIKGYILSMKVAAEKENAHAANEGEIDLATEKGLHERVKRHITELKYQVMIGESHSSNDVEAVMTDMLIRIKTKLLAIPAKLTPLLADQTDTGYIKDTIEAEVKAALEELSEYNAADFYGKDYIDTGDDADG